MHTHIIHSLFQAVIDQILALTMNLINISEIVSQHGTYIVVTKFMVGFEDTNSTCTDLHIAIQLNLIIKPLLETKIITKIIIIMRCFIMRCTVVTCHAILFICELV